MLLLGIDVGTSACKAAVFGESGAQLCVASREYPTLFPQPGWMELCPDTVWESVADCTRGCIHALSGAEISAVSVSSQGEAVIPVGESGEVLYNSILTFDNRCGAEVAVLSELFESGWMARTTGAPIHPMFTLPKIMWLKENEREIYYKAWKFLCYGDFVSYRLGADPAIDFTMAARTQMFDINAKIWSDDILGKAGIDKCKLPAAVGSGEVIGRVSKTASERTGLTEGTLIAAGTHDQSCCALGAGVVREGTVMDSMGTTESMLCVSAENLTGGALSESNIPCCVYAKNDLYAYLSFLTCSGSVVKWLKDTLLGDGAGFEHYENTAIGRRRPSGVMLLPYFAGSGTPYLDSNAKGVFAGLTLATDRYDMYLAALEGTAFEAARNIGIMQGLGIPIDEIRCTGGGAKSALWMQIKADALGMPVTTAEVGESGAMGAAMLAASAARNCDVGQVAESWCKAGRVFEPDLRQHERYVEAMEKHKRLYIRGLS